jgi:hypothetical protein
VRGNISQVTSWTGAALAYTIIGTLHDGKQLQFVCSNFTDLAAPWATLFADPSTNVTEIAQRAICDSVANVKNIDDPDELPKYVDILWYLKTYLAGTFTIETYQGNFRNNSYYVSMCYYLEDSLLKDMWLPGPDDGGGAVEIEGSLCASGGYYDKGPGFIYTNETVNATIAQQATDLVSKALARAVQVLANTDTKVAYICNRLKDESAEFHWIDGLKSLGLNTDIIYDTLCSSGLARPSVQAVTDYFNVLSDLYTLQLLNGADEPTYYDYLCQTLNATGLSTMRLNGMAIKKAACDRASMEA